jgi:muconolactone delta-isomerase
MHLQAMVNEIPDLADQLAASIEQMADHGELHALASKLPFREYRTAELLRACASR